MAAFIAKIPLFLRKFIVDFIETALGAIFALTLAGDAAAMLHAVLIAVGAAALSAARRELPDFLLYLRGLLQVPAE